MLRLILIVCLGFFACKSAIEQDLLYGSWKAAAFIENGVANEVDLNNVQFDFNRDGSYRYHGTLKQEESGRFYTVGKILFTTDTTAITEQEKSVKIIKLTTDSLFFQMNAAGTPQIFQLYKAK